MRRTSTHPSGASSSTEQLRSLSNQGRRRELHGFYGMGEDELLQRGDQVRQGDKTTWIGEAGKMILIDPDFVRPTDGNIFDADQLRTIAKTVQDRQHPSFLVGYGEVSLIDARDVEEDQIAFDRNELLVDQPLQRKDVGKLLYRIRDGNHRVFGALIGGESKVWIHLTPLQLRDVRAYREAKSMKRLKEHARAIGRGEAALMKRLDQKLSKD